jgi:hypothetical protein
MFRRKKRDEKERSDSGRQYWARRPSPLDALSLQLPDPQPADGEDKTEVYPDEIDPEWSDPDTAE